MPSAVLLAILVGVGVLVLIPALIRRYDSSSKVEEERASPAMRVLDRNTRRPGRNAAGRRRQSNEISPAQSHVQSSVREVVPAIEEQAEPIAVVERPHAARRKGATSRRRTVVLVGFFSTCGLVAGGAFVTPVIYMGAGLTAVATGGYLVAVRHAVRNRLRRMMAVRHHAELRRQRQAATAVRAEPSRPVTPVAPPVAQPPDEDLGRVAGL